MDQNKTINIYHDPDIRVIKETIIKNGNDISISMCCTPMWNKQK